MEKVDETKNENRMNPKSKDSFQKAGSLQYSDSLFGYCTMKKSWDNKVDQQKLIKYIFPFCIFLLTFNGIINAQEKFEKFTVSAGLTLPVPIITSNYYSLLDCEIGFLMNFKIFGNKILSTGLGLQYGEHVTQEEVGWLTMVNGKPNVYKGIGYWNLDFISTEIPVIFTVPFKKAFFDSYLVGFSFGQYWNTNLTRTNIPDNLQIKINKTYMDFNLGVKKNLFVSKKLTINLSPTLGYLFYLSDFNDWQKNYIFSQIKFNFNF